MISYSFSDAFDASDPANYFSTDDNIVAATHASALLASSVVPVAPSTPTRGEWAQTDI